MERRFLEKPPDLNLRDLARDYTSESLEQSVSIADEHLLKRVAQRDEAAFDELYRRHAGPIYNYLLRLIHEPPVAEDLLQEVFFAVWQGAGRFRGQAQVKTWLFHIAHNQAVSWLRRIRPTVAFDEQESELENDASNAEAGLDEHISRLWLAERVQSALDQLSPLHREVIELAFVHGLSYAEIAQIADCPVGTVKSRMSYARRYLNNSLRELKQ